MRGFLMNVLYFAQILFVASLSPKNAELVRDLMKKQNAPEWLTIQNSLQRDKLAFTSADLKHVYVDFARLAQAPHTLQNVIKHEIAHSQGKVHNDGSPYMQYAVKVDSANTVADDQWVLLP